MMHGQKNIKFKHIQWFLLSSFTSHTL